jgi:hypothetical protein
VNNSIKQWLIGDRDYNLGVALYAAHGGEERMNKMFAQGFSDYRQQKLIEAMIELEKTIASPLPIISPPKFKPVVVSEVQLPEERVPEEKDPYRSEWLPLFMERNHLRARLKDFPNDIDRGSAAFKILELQRQCEAIWQKRDYFLRTGQHMPPPTAGDIVTDPSKLQSSLLNIRSNISKAKKILEEDPGNTRASTRLQKYLSEKLAIEAQLQAHK